MPESARLTVRRIVHIALYYGLAGFGGGYSVLAQLRRDLVERRRILSAEDFLVLAELSKSLPARSALRSKRDVGLAVLCGVLLAIRIVSEPVIAATAVAVGAIWEGLRGVRTAPTPPKIESAAPRKVERLHGFVPLVLLPIVWAGGLGVVAALVRVFVPIGIMTFGGGLAMIPAIEDTVVVERGWLDPKAFADAIALGQITPGPVAICAAFIGYCVAGVLGAIVATAAMFAPATALALAVGRSVERFRSSHVVEGALRMLAPAVIGMLGAATFSLGRAAVAVHVDAALAFASFLTLIVHPLSPLWLLIGGGLCRVTLLWIAHR